MVHLVNNIIRNILLMILDLYKYDFIIYNEIITKNQTKKHDINLCDISVIPFDGNQSKYIQTHLFIMIETFVLVGTAQHTKRGKMPSVVKKCKC